MTIEATTVVAAIAVMTGILVGMSMTVDSVLDLMVAREKGSTALRALARTRLVSEAARLLIHLFLLTVLLTSHFAPGRYRRLNLWLLVLIPVVLSLSSLYAYVQKKRSIDEIERRLKR